METVYMLHGFLGTSYAHFGPQIRAWRNSYRVVPLDLPGHGRCALDASRPYYPSALQYLQRTAEEHGPGHMVGASYLGGSVAVRCAVATPMLTKSLVLTGYAPGVPADIVTVWAQSFHILAARPSTAVEYNKLHGERWRTTLDVVTSDVRENPTLASEPVATFQRLRVPTLVLNGSAKAEERLAAAQLPECNPLIQGGLIPSAGHIASQDQPKTFDIIVEAFWGRVGDVGHAS